MTNLSKDKLYLYELSDELLESLQLVQFDAEDHVDTALDSLETARKSKKSVESSDDDLIKYNRKREERGLKPLTEEEFDDLIERESMESLSGSESDEYSDSDDDLYKRMGETKIADVKLVEQNDSHLHSKTPRIYFKSSLIPEDKVLGVYKSMFNAKSVLDPINSLKAWQDEKRNAKSALFMLGGGHFAGGIISHKRKNIRGNVLNKKVSIQEEQVEVLKSKTFHKYTTRRKQGGSQSANDNAKGNAKSVGSNIRRQMEQSLIQEIRELLSSWESDLQECESIFIRANGPQGRKTIVGYEGAVIKLDDARLKTFPFTTKRATASELKRAWSILSYLSVDDAIKQDVKEKEKLLKQQENLKKSQQQKQKSVQEVSEADKHTSELIGFVKRQKAPILINYLKKNKLTPEFQLSPEETYRNTPTLLHFAAAQGLHHIVQILIVNLKADPTIKNAAGRVAAELCSNKQTRQIFQVVRHNLGEDFCDWKAAKVGEPRSKEEIQKEEEEEDEKLKAEKKKLIQEELHRKTELETKKPTYSSKGQHGGAPLLSDTSGLSEQQKLLVMREQRARAAEARFKKLLGN